MQAKSILQGQLDKCYNTTLEKEVKLNRGLLSSFKMLCFKDLRFAAQQRLFFLKEADDAVLYAKLGMAFHSRKSPKGSEKDGWNACVQ